MTSSKLLDKTLDLVRDRPRTITYDIIHAHTNIPVPWLKAFGQNRITHPSVIRVEQIYEFLAQAELKV